MAKALAAGWSSYELVNWHKYCRGVWDIATDRRTVDVVGVLLDDTMILRHRHRFAKLGGDGERVIWHQDAYCWPLTPSRIVSVWLAIDDVDAGNAAMQMIPDSQLSVQVPFRDSAADKNNVLVQMGHNPEDSGDRAVSVTMRAGQISLHSDWILRGPPSNNSGRRRCGLAMRCLSGGVRACYGWNQNSIVCRGVGPTGHWVNHPRLGGEFIPTKNSG